MYNCYKLYLDNRLFAIFHAYHHALTTKTAYELLWEREFEFRIEEAYIENIGF
jgi:hypothetical protein